ncbi:hypothetical protein [Streptomyces erythrochromogenes]|uniref:hypothetical protein n=1 Tax=Streptomyces erythrochromogenes TaxID=285574 RepID=UPI003809D25C
MTVADTRDKPDFVYYTIRVQGHVATLTDSGLQQGTGWELFPTVDLWSCAAATSQLHHIVRRLACRAPLIVCEEAA